MFKKTLFALTLPLVLLVLVAASPCRGALGSSSTAARRHSAVATASATGTLQKMIVENGSVTIDLDLNALAPEGAPGSLVATPVALQFVVGANSFFPILVFNNLLRAAEPGSMALIPAEAAVSAAGSSISQATRLPLQSLVVEKLSSDQRYDLAVRDGNTGFTFFNVEGGEYDYDAKAQSLSITNGRLLVSKEFASALGRPSDAGEVVGKISVGAAMQPIEVDQVVNGEPKSAVMPAVGTVPGPDVIIGELLSLVQLTSGAVNNRVGISLGTDACNKGTIDVDWLALPNNDHPFIPQNLYRMSGGATNNERFEQLGQSWGKHAFTAASSNTCGFGCNGVGGPHLGSGCSDAYGAGLNGDQFGIGSRAWVNPFTGNFPSGTTSNDHTGHGHDATSHRILVETSDLIPAGNPGATYFAEAEYIVPHERTWCQAHPDQCNMYNNASYKQYTVSGGPTNFSFSPVGSTVREQPAIKAWTGATVNQIQPAPGAPPDGDGIFFVGYKVTNPSAGVWHYEYALYNQNLDRSIQSFSVPVGAGVNISNVGFRAPPQHPGWANDGTFNNQGYSSTPWLVTLNGSSVTWTTETFAQNQNANAIRFGTLYNFRFDADQAPNPTNATVGYFKTGSPSFVGVQAAGNVPLPSPTPTPIPCAGLTIIQISGSIVPGTTDTGNHVDDGTTLVTLPFPYTLYDQTFTAINVDSNGADQFVNPLSTFTNTCLPYAGQSYLILGYWDDLYNVNSGFGIFTSISGTAPNRIFNIEHRSQYFPGSGSANYEVRLYEGQTRFDVIYNGVTNGNTSATAGVQKNPTTFDQYFCNGAGQPATGAQSYILTPCGTPTPTASPSGTPTATVSPTPTAAASATPTAAGTATPTATAACTPNYTFTSGTGTLVPGVTDSGNHCDDCTTVISLPFSVTLYDQSFTSATVGSNGIFAFGTNNNAFAGSCLPVPTVTYETMPFYRDQRTDSVGGCTGCGIFTTTSGTAPNRIFRVEYRTIYFGETSATPTLNYEVNIYENGSPAFDYTYGL